jgi:hypothetical protein
LALDRGGCSSHTLAALTRERDTVLFVQEAGWTSGPVWTGAENLAPTGFRCLIITPSVCDHTYVGETVTTLYEIAVLLKYTSVWLYLLTVKERYSAVRKYSVERRDLDSACLRNIRIIYWGVVLRLKGSMKHYSVKYGPSLLSCRSVYDDIVINGRH